MRARSTIATNYLNASNRSRPRLRQLCKFKPTQRHGSKLSYSFIVFKGKPQMKWSVFQSVAIVFTISVVSLGSQAAPSQDDLVAGKKLFERSSCAGCHPGGTNLLHPNQPLKGKSFQAKYKDDASIAKVVRSGVANSGMPAFSQARLSDQDLRKIIAYVRSLTPSTADNKH
jgi:mono/diheme cytochrome c family protein